MLNLLPAQRKADIALRRTFEQWRRAGIIIILGVVLSSAGIAGVTMQLRQRTTDVSTDIALLAQSPTSKNTAITTSTNSLNQTIRLFSSILPTSRSWNASIATILNELPNNITVSQCLIRPDGTFTLVGTAATRSSFLELDTTMKTSKKFTGVSTNSQASRKDNVPFSYTGALAQ